MKFSKIELGQLGICMLVMGFCFSFGWFFNREGEPLSTNLMNFFVYVVVSIVAIGLGFFFHEVAHKLVAQSYGCWAEFRIWKPGLILAIATSVLSFGTFIFLAPGAVNTISSRQLSIKEDETVPVEQADRLYVEAGEPKQKVILPGAGHRLRQDERAVTTAMKWLAEQVT